MSKTTDVLCIGGVRGGMKVNVDVPPTTYIEFPFAGGLASYTRSTFEIGNNRYHIATPTGEPVPGDSDIVSALVTYDHKPAWDLRDPFPTPRSNAT